MERPGDELDRVCDARTGDDHELLIDEIDPIIPDGWS
jgi:hypothetical protein